MSVSIRGAVACLFGVALAAGAQAAEKHYGPGVSDDSIRIGQTMPYSGPFSAYAAIGRAEVAYVQMINERGGVNGRKIILESLDDGYSPPKTVEQTRMMVEKDDVFAIVGTLGASTNAAIRKYLNHKQVPQLFAATGTTEFGDPEHYPWTMGLQPPYQVEGRIYAAYILKTLPQARIAALYQDDDFGRDYIKGLTDGLGDQAKTMLVKTATYVTTDPTVDSQIVELQGSGADLFFNAAGPKQAAQAIRKAYDIGWHPTQIVVAISASVGTVLKPAGFDKATGIISASYMKDPNAKQWANEPSFKAWVAWMKHYNPTADFSDQNNVYGYIAGQTLVQVLKQCGDELTRENFLRQATNLKDFKPAMLLPGITINTSPSNYFPLRQMRLQRFDGKTWQLFGDVVGG